MQEEGGIRSERGKYSMEPVSLGEANLRTREKRRKDCKRIKRPDIEKLYVPIHLFADSVCPAAGCFWVAELWGAVTHLTIGEPGKRLTQDDHFSARGCEFTESKLI